MQGLGEAFAFDHLQQHSRAVDAGLVNYHFDFNLTLLGADLQHGIVQHHAELEDELGHELSDEEKARLRTVRYCSGVPDGNDDEDSSCGNPVTSE